jgi:hypothetical protein
MPRYRVKGKHIYYASVMDLDMGLDERGEPRIVRQMGPTERVEVGTILEDVPAHVLAAFPGRFELVQESPAPPAAPPAPARRETHEEASPARAQPHPAEPDDKDKDSGQRRPHR